MEKEYKTFEDLEFKKWGNEHIPNAFLKGYTEPKQARIDFPNGYGVSVLNGDMFYSNGLDTYELAVTFRGALIYPPDICTDNDVLGYLTRAEITEVMRKLQDK